MLRRSSLDDNVHCRSRPSIISLCPAAGHSICRFSGRSLGIRKLDRRCLGRRRRPGCRSRDLTDPFVAGGSSAVPICPGDGRVGSHGWMAHPATGWTAPIDLHPDFDG